MGTDIHYAFQHQAHSDEPWQDIAPQRAPEITRYYPLFALLAGVRNGYGFAGIQTGEPVTPIAEPRGLPFDFIDRYRWWDLPNTHSQSCLSATEMLAWYAAAQAQPLIVCKTGVLDRQTYEAWDGVSSPSRYSGAAKSVSGVLVWDNAVARAKQPHWTDIRCEWTENLAFEFSDFFDAVAALHLAYGTPPAAVRMVFCFDH